jgi:hypothetical protein
MPTIYLDHNVVHYYVRGFPNDELEGDVTDRHIGAIS